MKLSKRQAESMGIIVGRRKRAKKAECDVGADIFDKLCKSHGLPAPVHEYRFHPTRKWRFDFLFEGWLAVEKVGGVFVAGRHSRGVEQVRDMERRNEAQLLGYLVLEFTPEQFDSGAAFAVIRRALECEP